MQGRWWETFDCHRDRRTEEFSKSSSELQPQKFWIGHRFGDVFRVAASSLHLSITATCPIGYTTCSVVSELFPLLNPPPFWVTSGLLPLLHTALREHGPFSSDTSAWLAPLVAYAKYASQPRPCQPTRNTLPEAVVQYIAGQMCSPES